MSELGELLKKRAVRKGKTITLASGRTSDIYVDCKRVTLHGASLEVVARTCVEKLLAVAPDLTHVAGVSVGGDPLVAGIILAAHGRGREMEALLVRKEKKSHGLSEGRCVEGGLPAETRSVWLVEDVVSTGGSSAKAAADLKAEGYPLKGMLCLVDREMGGVESLEARFGVPVVALLKVSELA